MKINYDICYSSPMKRALETANILILKKYIKIDTRLNEINYGDYEGLNFNEVRLKDKKFSKLLTQNQDPNFPNGESTKDVHKRINQFIQFLTKSKDKKKLILVVTHNVVMRCLIGKSLGIKTEDWYKIKIPYFAKFNIIVYNNKILLNMPRSLLNNVLKNIYG